MKSLKTSWKGGRRIILVQRRTFCSSNFENIFPPHFIGLEEMFKTLCNSYANWTMLSLLSLRNKTENYYWPHFQNEKGNTLRAYCCFFRCVLDL